LLAERGVVSKEGLWMVRFSAVSHSDAKRKTFVLYAPPKGPPNAVYPQSICRTVIEEP
jgi:hypothetical protein